MQIVNVWRCKLVPPDSVGRGYSKKKFFFSVLFLIFTLVPRFSRKQKLKDLLDMHLLLSPSGDLSLFFRHLWECTAFGGVYIFILFEKRKQVGILYLW